MILSLSLCLSLSLSHTHTHTIPQNDAEHCCYIQKEERISAGRISAGVIIDRMEAAGRGGVGWSHRLCPLQVHCFLIDIFCCECTCIMLSFVFGFLHTCFALYSSPHHHNCCCCCFFLLLLCRKFLWVCCVPPPPPLP